MADIELTGGVDLVVFAVNGVLVLEILAEEFQHTAGSALHGDMVADQVEAPFLHLLQRSIGLAIGGVDIGIEQVAPRLGQAAADLAALVLAVSMADVLDHGNLSACLIAHLGTADGFFQAHTAKLGNSTGLGCTATLAIGTGDNHAVGAFGGLNGSLDVGSPALGIHIAVAAGVGVAGGESTAVGILDGDSHRTDLGQPLDVAVDLHRGAAAVLAIDDDGQLGGVADTLSGVDVLLPVIHTGGDAVHGILQFAAADQHGIVADQLGAAGRQAIIDTGCPNEFAFFEKFTDRMFCRHNQINLSYGFGLL